MRIAGITPESNTPIIVVTEGTDIVAVEQGINRPDVGSEDVYISPGMIDLMVPGYAGTNFSNPELSDPNIRTVAQHFYAHGTTHFCPLVMTSSPKVYQKVLPVIANFIDQEPEGKSILGVHMEGPYLSGEAGVCGAHHPVLMRDPDFEQFKHWYQLAGNHVAIVTVAPERNGAAEFIRQACRLGVKVAIGHTATSSEQLNAAISAGADMSTHLGNGAHSMIHRWDNYIFRQLADDRLWAGVIADGDHLPQSNLRIWFRTKGKERIILVSDASPQAGLAGGVYKQSDMVEVRVDETGQIVVNDGSGNLAGAGHLLSRGVANALNVGEFSLAECLNLATANPARYMGLDHLGSLQVSKEASMFLFEKDIGQALKVRQTILAGEVVYSR